MADQGGGVPAPNHPPNQKQHHQQQNQYQAGQQQQVVHLNLSDFKPEFSGKPDEYAEAHLLYSNDWMNAHHFVDGVKVQRFCLTLLEEVGQGYKICLGYSTQK